MQSVTFALIYTRREYVRSFQKYLKATKRADKSDLIAMPFLLIGSGIAMPYFSFHVLSIAAFILLAVYACILLYALYIQPIRTYNSYTKLHCEYRATFSQYTIEIETLSAKSILQWDYFSCVWENEEFFYLIEEPPYYWLVPKRVFAGPAELAAFKAILAGAGLPHKQIA